MNGERPLPLASLVPFHGDLYHIYRLHYCTYLNTR